MRKAVVWSLALLCIATAPTPHEAGWFVFAPKNHFRPGEIGLAHWLDAPAGKHGFVQMRGDRLMFENGTLVRFWGVNIGSEDCYPATATADSLAAYWAKYGVNGVRLHKFTWTAHHGDSSTVLRPAFWQRFDYFQQKLRQRGIYYGWSHIYGHRVRPADRTRLLAYDEIASLRYPWRHLNGTTASLVNFAPDLQDLNIELTVNMLRHVNPHTGKRYADDPALAFIELQNEDNIYWGAIQESLKQAPSYRRLLCRQFAAWLRSRYGNDEQLRAAWGSDALPVGEGIAVENVFPNPNHGLFGHAYETAQRNGAPMPQHLLDKMTFLYEQQDRFYQRFVRAIRATGYRGYIVGSCWQAGSGVSHYYNLLADYRAGAIDRHNYFGGGSGHNLDTGRVATASMLTRPGAGLLGTGLQQVADRPFVLSEWMSMMPNEWIAESAPLVAFYGMGLQGWDGSFHFASNRPGFAAGLASDGGGVYNVDSPTQIGLYPALARIVHRGDVQEGRVVSVRRVDTTALQQGRLGFRETVNQIGDAKDFGGDVPAYTLAVGRAVAAFENGSPGLKQEDLRRYQADSTSTLASVTGQLRWHRQGKGFVTLNTPHSKAVVGFADGYKHDLGEVNLTVNTPFAVVIVTASEPDKTLKQSKKWLVTTVARAANTGMVYSNSRERLLRKGNPPLLLEPVDVTLAVPGRRLAAVHVLDHDGENTGQTVAASGNAFRLDGRRYRTLYYAVEFK